MSKQNQVVSKERVRPSIAVEVAHQEKKARGHNRKPISQASVRNDNIDYFLFLQRKKGSMQASRL